MQQEIAQVIALNALGWLASNEDLFPIFLGASGSSIDDVKNRANEPEFHLAILDFILMDDAWVIAFSDAADIDPQIVQQARHALPGGGDVHWT